MNASDEKQEKTIDGLQIDTDNDEKSGPVARLLERRVARNIRDQEEKEEKKRALEAVKVAAKQEKEEEKAAKKRLRQEQVAQKKNLKALGIATAQTAVKSQKKQKTNHENVNGMLTTDVQSQLDHLFNEMDVGSRALRSLPPDKQVDQANEKYLQKKGKKLEKLRKQREKTYPVDDALVPFEPLPLEDPNTVVPKRTDVPCVDAIPSQVLGTATADDHETTGVLLSVWNFIRLLAAERVIGVSGSSCGETNMSNWASEVTELTDTAENTHDIRFPSENVNVEIPEMHMINAEALLPSMVCSGSMCACLHGDVKTSKNSDEQWTLSNNFLKHFPVKPSTMLPETLASVLTANHWRGYRLLSRVHVALLKLLIEDAKPKPETENEDSENSESDDDVEDEQEDLFDDEAVREVGIVPHLALLSPISWPEVLRLCLQCLPNADYFKDVIDEQGHQAILRLREVDYWELSVDEKLSILRALMDLVSCTKTFSRLMMSKAKERQRILDARKTEQQRESLRAREARKQNATKAKQKKARQAEWRKSIEEQTSTRKTIKAENNNKDVLDMALLSISMAGDHDLNNLSDRQKQALVTKRRETEAELRKAAQSHDIGQLKNAIALAKESGCGFQHGRDKSPDVELLQAMIALSKLEEEEAREQLKEEEEIRRLKIEKRFESKLQSSSMRARLLGRDFKGNQYWLFSPDPGRIWIERTERDSSAAQIHVDRAIDALKQKSHRSNDHTEEEQLYMATRSNSTSDSTTQRGRGHRGPLISNEDLQFLRSNIDNISTRAASLLAYFDPTHLVQKWAFIDTLEDMKTLMSTLDVRGKEEAALYKRLENLRALFDEHMWSEHEKRVFLGNQINILRECGLSIPDWLSSLGVSSDPEADTKSTESFEDSSNQNQSQKSQTKMTKASRELAALLNANTEMTTSRRSAAINADKNLRIQAGMKPTTSKSTKNRASRNEESSSEDESDIEDVSVADLRTIQCSAYGYMKGAILAVGKRVHESPRCTTRIQWLRTKLSSVPPYAKTESWEEWYEQAKSNSNPSTFTASLLELEAHMYQPQREDRALRFAEERAKAERRRLKQKKTAEPPEDPILDDRPDGWSDAEEMDGSNSEVNIEHQRSTKDPYSDHKDEDKSEDDDDDDDDGSDTEPEEEGEYVLWPYRSHRRKWRTIVRNMHTVAAVSTAALDLLSRANTGGLLHTDEEEDQSESDEDENKSEVASEESESEPETRNRSRLKLQSNSKVNQQSKSKHSMTPREARRASRQRAVRNNESNHLEKSSTKRNTTTTLSGRRTTATFRSQTGIRSEDEQDSDGSETNEDDFEVQSDEPEDEVSDDEDDILSSESDDDDVE